MNRLPAVVVDIDVRKEHNALREAASLGIPRICLIDTDSDPDQADIAIPGNDDAMRAIELIMRELADSAEEGRKARPEPTESSEGRSEGRRRGPRGSRGGEQGGARPPRPEPAAVPAATVPTAPSAPAPTPAPASGQPEGGEVPTT